MEAKTTSSSAPLDLSRWRNMPTLLMVAGGAVSLLGLFNLKEFAFSWLLAFMFFLSLCLGALFLVLAHHLFDAGWSVAIRRFCEHITSLLFPWMLLLFIPIALFARAHIYAWMISDPATDKALAVKHPLFTMPGFYLTSAGCFLIWWLLTNRLRFWSLEQDRTGAALPTHKMRMWAGLGVVLYAVTLTLGVFMWMSALEYKWFSTMYAVIYFAGSVWMTLATVYVITMILDRQRVLSEVLHEHQYYFIGSLMFAFTVFYAYVHFAQYFIIWNANMPEETAFYTDRWVGSWKGIAMVIIFGHFFLPFLALLRIDVKHVFKIMVPLCIWAWLMHWVDLSFNIMPLAHPTGFPFLWIWLHLGCFAFMAGLLSWRFLVEYSKHPPYPLKDPRLIEAMGFYHPVPTQISGGELGEADELRDAPPQFQGGAH